MAADARARIIALESELRRVEGKLDGLALRVSELERLIIAVTRGNAGKGERRVGA